MAADGSTIDITSSSSNCVFQGGLGDQFQTGCVITWQSLNLPSADTKQDYVIIPGNGNEIHTSATATGGTYGGTSGNVHNTTLSTAGTYIFGVYDTTAGKWLTVIYVNAGAVNLVKVYQDAFHTQEQYQFSASSGTNAYIFLQNASQSDYYVVGVSQTSVNPNCVFMGPAPLPSPYSYVSNELCQVQLSSGVQAPGGNLSVTWPLSASYAAGNYSIEVYDITQGQRVGQVQVALTGASGIVLNMYPDDSVGLGGNPNPSPAPPTTGATPSTTFAYDGDGIDESVSGVKTTVTGLTNGTNYLWSLSDPQGQVVGTASGTIAATSGSNIFTFDNLTGGANAGGQASLVQSPGNYPAKSFVVQLYDTTHKVVDASQAFNIVGYSSLTQFNNAGSLQTSLALTPGGGGTVRTMRFTNNSGGIWNGFGDNLKKIIFTSGPDFNVSATTGNGVMMNVNGGGTPCASCTETVSDSTGNSWLITVTCPSSSTNKNGECNLEADPVAAGTTLAPGAYIDVTNITWFNATGSVCGNSCTAMTSEFPVHGLHWSDTTNTVTWNPVYFRNASATESATAKFRFYGTCFSCNINFQNGTANVDPHYFQFPYFGADYNNNAPYNNPVTSNFQTQNTDIWSLNVVNTGTQAVTEIALQFPPLLANQGFWAPEVSLNAQAWAVAGGGGSNGCPVGFNASWICMSGGSISGGGGTDTIYFVSTVPNQSYAFTDLQVQTLTSKGWTGATATAGTDPTPDGKNAALDNLAIGSMSLNAGEMTGSFNPSTAGTGGTSTLGWQYTNTSLAQDANPDSIDAIVLEAPNTTVTLGSVPTVSNAGWSYLGKLPAGGSFHNQYWFGLCSAQFTSVAVTGAGYGGPPTATGGVGYPLTSTYPKMTSCGASETNSASAGVQVVASNMQFSNLGSAGTQTWRMYAHGANGGGWSTAIPFALTISAESAAIWFNQVNGSAVASNTTPTIGSSPNSYQYAIKNTSSSSSIGTIVVTIPGLDINNQNAYDGSQAWAVTSITSGGVTLSNPAGQTDGTGGCSVSTLPANTFNPTTGGANGRITISGCTTFKPGDIIYVNFSAANPSSQNDTYVWPATVDGTSAGPQWLGSDYITEQFTLGLNVVVNPSNPGPGGSTPVVNCSIACSFSGTTIDFGNIANSSSGTYTDVVRTSIIYTGATSVGHNIQLLVQANNNPVTSGLGGSPSNELQTEVDSANSTSGAGITFNQTTFAVVPTATTLLLATAPETSRASGYDVIDTYKVSIGTEATSAQTVILTYTVVAI